MNKDGPSAPALVEAVLFSSSRPVDAATLAFAAQLSREDVEEAVSSLRRRYSPEFSGVVLREVAGGYQLTASPECSGAVERFRGESRPSPLSGAATEVLAAVLYFGPLTRSEVSASRGVNSDAVVRSLLDRGLLAESNPETPGAPASLDVTEQFLVAAGASSREDFPALDTLVEQEELDRVRERVAGPTGSAEEGQS